MEGSVPYRKNKEIKAQITKIRIVIQSWQTLLELTHKEKNSEEALWSANFTYNNIIIVWIEKTPVCCLYEFFVYL